MDNKFQRFVVLLDQIEGVETTTSQIRAHVKFLKDLEKKGILEFCGPFLDYKGGMLILKTNTLEEAQAIANNDPFVQEGVRCLEVRTWALSCEDNNHLGMG